MASLPIRLYHFPASFYSQRALLALEEKNVKYKSTVIEIHSGEQNEAWYLRLNPAGQVPMLQVGEEYISGSDNILDVADTLNNAPVLIPDPNTTEGKLVKQWRSRIMDVEVEKLTFGVLLNPELAIDELAVPSSFRFSMEDHAKRNAKLMKKLEAVKEKNPDLTEAIDKKIASRTEAQNQFEKSLVVAAMEDLEGLFDDLEVQLRKSRNENIIEHWLCGPTFTVADISLCVLLGRLKMIGIISRYLNAEKRPAVVEYWNQAQLRPSVIKVVLNAIKNVMVHRAKTTMAKVAVGTAVGGGVVALGLFLGQKFKS